MCARPRPHAALRLGLSIAIVALSASAATAQPLGTFRWQLAPFCNIVTLAVTQNAGVFEVEGTDDQCGASGTQASAIGTAFINPDGSVGIGLNIISTPGGAPVHVDATITVATLGGTWRDSVGNAGSFVFTPGGSTSGSPRPAPTSGISPGSVGSAQVNPSQVQLRVNGSCASGSFMQGIASSGAVSCASEAGDITTVNAGAGLFGGGTSGAVAIALASNPNGAFVFSNQNGWLASGTIGAGLIPTIGPGTRAMWYSGKAAFRAGTIEGSQWDETSVGLQSVAIGFNTLAKGAHSTAFGSNTEAIGTGSAVFGSNTRALGSNSVAAGHLSVAEGEAALAIGSATYAGGHSSVALGHNAFTSTAAFGSFVFADFSSGAPFGALGQNEFNVRAGGGVRLYSQANLSTGCTLTAGSAMWACTSDRNSKERFEPVDGEMVLAKLRAMSIDRWSYRTEPGVSHVGPVAQDFHAAFGLGVDDKTVGHLDLSGIALRAIQALEARTRELMRENAELRARLEALEGKRP